jgi:acyl carrier protein
MESKKMNDSIFNKVIEIIIDICDIDAEEIQYASSIIDDLNLSSIEIISVISELQRTYDVEFSEKEMMGIETVEDLVELIADKTTK